MPGRPLTLYAVRIQFWGHGIPDSAPGPDYTLEILGPVMILADGTERLVDTSVGPDQAWLGFVNSKLTRAIAKPDGTLVAHFVEGSRVTIPAQKEYEAWRLEGEDGSLFVSVLGRVL